MIKKIFLGLGITLLGFINFLNAGFTQQIGSTYDSNINSNYKIKFLNGGAFESSYLGLSKNFLALRDNVVVWRSKNGFPYFYLESSNVPYFGLYQGFPDRYYLCDEITLGQINVPGNCTESNIWNYSGNNENIKIDLQNFFKKVKQNDLVYYNFVDFNWEVYLQLCRNSSELGKSLCFKVGKDNGYISGNVVYHVVNPLINSQNLNDDFGFALVPTDWIGYAPGQNGYNGGSVIGDGGIELDSIDSALNYYEKHYGWDSSICYAGVNSLSYVYGQNGVSYTPGAGLSIFEVYEGLYGNENNKKDFLLYSSRWLNSWLINYHEWFDSGGNPSWLAYYNSGTHLVDYNFDNLTFPFANQPVAIYFLTDNIQSQTEQITQGEEIISYCNIKINNGTFDEIIGSGNKYNINSYTEQGNTNVGLNPDGTKHEYTGAFLGSGVELAFSGNVSIKNTLKNFFDKLNDSISINAVPGVVSILPDWLVVAFLTIMLFKFFRKKS